MLQTKQNSTLNHKQHTGFLLIVHVNMGMEQVSHISTFFFFFYWLTSISQYDYHTSVQIDGQLVLFEQLFRNKAVAGATINQSYSIKRLVQLAPFSAE